MNASNGPLHGGFAEGMAAPVLEVDVATHIGELELSVSFRAEAETVVVIGPNGAGKSTLLKLLLGALAPERGRIVLKGRVLLDTDQRTLVPIERRRIGYVPQDYGLFPHYSVEQHLTFALKSRPQSAERSDAQRRAHVNTTLENLDLYQKRMLRPAQLSGGERQRLALARALVAEPDALLLDEPLAALDALHRREVRDFLVGYLAQLSIPTLLVSHDVADVRHFPGRVLALAGGQVVQDGPWATLESNPAPGFVAQFVRS